jgi:hypothetical protein
MAVEKVEKAASRYVVLTYPADPSPVTVDWRLGPTAKPETVDKMVEANSVGSIKLLIYSSRPCVVDTREREETYPDDPRPSTVDSRFGEDKNPDV